MSVNRLSYTFLLISPSVLSSISAEDGVYVFQPKNQKPCSADVTIRTDTKKIVDACFTVTTPLRKLGGGQQIGYVINKNQ